jgi:hypothetical protein
MKTNKTTQIIAIIFTIAMLITLLGCREEEVVYEYTYETEATTPQIVNVYREIMPATRFIGIKYTNEDRGECGGFGERWQWMFSEGHFGTLRALLPENPKEFFHEIDATIGLMRMHADDPFQYWIGMFLPPDTEVPEGFEYINFPRTEIGVAWVYGQSPDIFWHCSEAVLALEEYGVEIRANQAGEWWQFERYVCPRFTTPNEYGNVILDRAFFIVHCGRCGAACRMYEGN